MNKTIEGISDLAVYKMVIRDRMRVQLATVIGFIAFVISIILIVMGFSLYERLYIALGGEWSEPSLVNALGGCLSIYLVGLVIGLAVRGWLIYKWVAR